MEDKSIFCGDCGKLLLKVSGDSRGTLVCWCRRCRAEKRILIEP